MSKECQRTWEGKCRKGHQRLRYQHICCRTDNRNSMFLSAQLSTMPPENVPSPPSWHQSKIQAFPPPQTSLPRPVLFFPLVTMPPPWPPTTVLVRTMMMVRTGCAHCGIISHSSIELLQCKQEFLGGALILKSVACLNLELPMCDVQKYIAHCDNSVNFIISHFTKVL